MRRQMHQIAVETNDDGDIVISQAVGDMNNPDPEIIVSPDQVPLISAWLFEAAAEGEEPGDGSEEEAKIPVKFWARGPEADSVEMEIFNNRAGMIVLKFDADTFIEISPSMAKRMRDRLSRAITGALTNMFRPDNEV